MNRLRLQLQRKCLTRWYRSPPPVSSNSTVMRKRPTKLHKKWIITVTVTIRANDDHRIHTGCQPASQSFAHAQFIRKVLFLRSRNEQIFGDDVVVFFSWLFQKSSWTLKQRMSLWNSVAVLVVDAEVGVVSESVFHTWTIAYVSHTNLFFIAMVKVKMGYIHGRLWSWEFLYGIDSYSCKI